MMDPVWIKVFILTLSECVAPAGKTVCQEHEVEMQFLAQAECEVALQQLIALKNQSATTIVNGQESGCAPSARQVQAYASPDAVKAASNAGQWHEPAAATEDAASTVSHAERLASLSICEESLGIAPCRKGDIIVEATSSGIPVEIWRRDN
ncbi:MAG: hypothetical protein O2907_00860 [Proteobacteria bacterium]|nr:hypothetical protein [Pseudomonadota bacterium]